MKLASIPKRILASFIDSCLGVGIGYYIGGCIGYVYGNSILIISVVTLTICLYYTILESSKLQASIGKQVCHLYIATVDNKRVSFLVILIRYVILQIPALLYYILAFQGYKELSLLGVSVSILVLQNLGKIMLCLPALFKSRAGIHDMLTHTMVYQK